MGWLLAAGAGGTLPRHLAGALWRANRAVLAGTSPGAGEEEDSALSLAARVTRFGTRLPDGAWAGLPLYSRPGAASPAAPSLAGDSEMLRAVLLDLRQRARSRRPYRTALVQGLTSRTALVQGLKSSGPHSRHRLFDGAEPDALLLEADRLAVRVGDEVPVKFQLVSAQQAEFDGRG